MTWPIYMQEMEGCQFKEIFITGSTRCCQNDNFRYSQWWQFHWKDLISIMVHCLPTNSILLSTPRNLNISECNAVSIHRDPSPIQTPYPVQAFNGPIQAGWYHKLHGPNDFPGFKGDIWYLEFVGMTLFQTSYHVDWSEMATYTHHSSATREQGKSEGFDSCHRPSNLTQIGLNLLIFQPVWPWN